MQRFQPDNAIELADAVTLETCCGRGPPVDRRGECLSRSRYRSPSVELVEDPGEVAVIHEMARRKRETRRCERPDGVHM